MRDGTLIDRGIRDGGSDGARVSASPMGRVRNHANVAYRPPVIPRRGRDNHAAVRDRLDRIAAYVDATVLPFNAVASIVKNAERRAVAVAKPMSIGGRRWSGACVRRIGVRKRRRADHPFDARAE